MLIFKYMNLYKVLKNQLTNHMKQALIEELTVLQLIKKFPSVIKT